ncbi:autotransporter-associated N-terminal domain-containing protein [Leptotrichia sp. HSP-334]|uniref:Autotransporter-associated N-terminal domain-containing protein n=1 Tax=Leptotrichia rugosa TaxID=3239302 RepID=A0AB39VI86_9FUSO
MTNNLKKLKQELKSFAKRVKDFKYTDAALISFLLTGAIGIGGISINLFSAEDEIKVQTKAMNTSIVQLKQDFRKARAENNKLLRNTNLELIQLMEQGDHVVKSPWSSWQYGINGFYNNWQGHYKGRGDKVADVKYERDKTMGKYKYNTTPDAHSLYGNTTDLGLKQEPVAIIPVSASLTPLVPKVKVANVSMAVDISDLPSFEPRTVTPPSAPSITPIGTINAPSFVLKAKSLGNWNEDSFDNASKGNGGVIEGGLIINDGNFITKRIQNYPDGYGIYNYEYENYSVKNAFNNYSAMVTDSKDKSVTTTSLSYGNSTSNLNRGLTTTKKKAGFMRMVSDRNYNSYDQGSTLVNKANFLYTRMPGLAGPFINELVHLDMHGAAKITDQISKLGTTTGAEYEAFSDLQNIANNTTGSKRSQTFINSGKVTIEGENSSFVNTYDHARDNDPSPDGMYVASIVNTSKGDVSIHPYVDGSGKHNTQSAVFIVSAEVAGKGNPQIIYNAGNISLYNEKSAIYFINPNGDVRWNHTGEDFEEAKFDSDVTGPYSTAGTLSKNTASYTSGTTVNFDKDDDDQREITIVNRATGNKAVKTFGDGDVGVYLKTSKYISTANLDFKTKSTGGTWAPLTIYGDNSIGLYAPKDETSKLTTKLSGTVIGNFAVNIGDISGNSYEYYESKTIANPSNVPDSETTAGITGKTQINDDKYIDKSYGIFSSISVDFEKNTTKTHSADPTNGKGIENGHEINLFKNVKDSIGVLTGDSATIKLGKGKVSMNGGFDNTGIIVGGSDTSVPGTKSTDGKVTGDVITIDGDSRNDRGNRAIYVGNNSKNEVNVNAVVSTNATNSITLVADKGAKITVNDNTTKSTATIIGTSGAPTNAGVEITGSEFLYDKTRVNSDLTSKDNVGAAYASNGGIIAINRTSTTKPGSANISIKGGIDTQSKKNVGFGFFADGTNSEIDAQYNWIKVEDGSTNTASLNNAKIDLTGATVEYKGNGYALYTDTTSNNSGAININDATLKLDGDAVGYVFYQDKSGIITVNKNTIIDILSDNVIVADLRKISGKVTVNVENKGTPDTLKEQLIGGVGNVGSSNGKTRYKYAVVDDADINIKSAIDKANSTKDTDSEVFSRRFLYQNSRLNVETGGSVKSELNDSQLQAIDLNLKTPVGLAVTASAKTENTSTTGINNNGKIEADRTVGTDKGGIGLYVDYGFINNNSTGVVNVEKGTVNAPNEKAIGIFGTNSTRIVNNGKVNAGGKKSIGILGLSYRIDSTAGIVKDPKDEPYYNNVVAHSGHTFGIVNIENGATGKITMDDDGAVGMFVKNNSNDKNGAGYIVTNALDRRTKNDTHGINKGEITINGSNSSVGMGANNGIITNDNSGKININGTKSAGMYGTNDSDLINNGEINVVATSAKNESIGMYIDDQKSTIVNTGKINVGKSSYGIFGKKVDMTSGEINVADDGVGVYSTGPSVNLAGGKINVANNNSVGVYIADDTTNSQPATVTGNVDMKVGDTDSFGYLITASNAKTDLTTHAPNDVHIGEKSVYIYSGAPKALGGKIENYSNIVTDKNNGYGIYSSQDSINHGNINLMSGNGNIGIYSTQGTGKNYGTIEVGMSDVTTKQYGIGMATGYYDENTKAASNVGTVENYGTINVTKENSVGMYAVGRGAKAVNRGTINLDGKNTTGMYIDRYAEGENYGVIQTTPTANGTGIKGVVVTNGGVIKNYGTIKIMGSKNIGVYVFRGDETSSTYKPYEEHGTGNTSTRPYLEGTATDKKITGKAIVKVPPASLPSAVSISIDGVQVEPVKVDTNVASPQAPEVNITDLTGVTTLNLATEQMDHNHTHSNGEISSIGMYVDTSGINYTNPIQGLSNLYGLTDIDLIMGTEVTKYLNAKAIQIGDNILKPYNDALASVVSTGVTLNVNSSSLTWIAQPVESGNIAAPIKTVYMVKIPYTDFASKNDVDTEHFLDGLEQRYGVEGIHSREKQIFNKLNDLGKGENHIFAQAVNEMKGYEYSNTQQRINATGNTLDKEFKYLHDEWRNPSKQSNKIKVFGRKDEYRTDTAGVIDYDSNAYGVAYVHDEDEAITLGNSAGWYAGAVSNRFKFKDLGKSTEQQSMIRAGVFKTVSPVKDHNGNLRWTIAGDVFGGVNNMHRKFWVVDDTFYSKADYYTYGAALKTDLGYDIRLSERTHLRPYGALKMEYGRFTDINEDRGQMNLEVKGNDYFSVKPEVGAEFKYIQPLAVRTQLSIGLSAAYENEIGKLNRLNQARVRYTTADWYNLRNDKEDRHGNGKFDLNLGIDNTRFGVTVNAGYDTKGENVRGGLGFRLIY